MSKEPEGKITGRGVTTGGVGYTVTEGPEVDAIAGGGLEINPDTGKPERGKPKKVKVKPAIIEFDDDRAVVL